MEYKKIITHDGRFHADEVCSIAKLRHCGILLPIERKRTITLEELADPAILVIDVGKDYNPALGNFDHHQDSSLPASNILIADWLTDQGLITPKVREVLQGFLQSISDTDRGIIPHGGPAGSINHIIRSLNHKGESNPQHEHDRFCLAVDMMEQMVFYQFEVAEEVEHGFKRWQKLERILNGLVVVENTPRLGSIIGWTHFAKEEGVRFQIVPNDKNEGEWLLISADTTTDSISEDTNRQTFRANAGNMAIYKSKKDVLDHVSELVSVSRN